ncbi:MAG TPA: patatin-like protein, partial [Burkholderiales bacterium]|nr:patatin-like protein [Burkholderiales bacterium]
TAPIRSRFVVDILSGTSAGGINSIYLAKALANRQSMEGVKKLWISEGDISTLINDNMSLEKVTGLKLQRPPQSLLNSRRMYCKLLEALDQMGQDDAGKTPSPLVQELDLFITTTDIEGLPIPIALSDGVIYERRHRNVFHFRYAQRTENDFIKSNDPFLAYAARCTASFPFAFEPMCLADIAPIAGNYESYRSQRADQASWEKFYSEYWRSSVSDFSRAAIGGDATSKNEAELKTAYLTRAFGDGGYLDNKPFSYATSMVMRRRADVPVRRKLLYIEPVPGHPEAEAPRVGDRPDFAENIRTAMELPGREMIREDIERVLERNRVLARISAYTRDVDADVAAMTSDRLDDAEDPSATLAESVDRYGVAYGAYHRLRLDDTSGMLAHLILRAAQLDPNSGAALAVRALVTAWRCEVFASNPQPGSGMRSEAQLLDEFDVQFKLRRLTFISRRINELAPLNEKAEALLGAWMKRSHHLREMPESFKETMRDDAWRESFRAELRELKKGLSEDRAALRSAQDTLARIDGGRTPLTEAVTKLDLSWAQLEEILHNGGAAVALIKEKRADFDALAERIRSAFRVPLGFGTQLQTRRAQGGGLVARDCLDFYYRQYQLYDMVLFPVQYGTGSAESSEIEIYRISPEDATQLIDERNDSRGRRKLAGTTLMNFGAFLEQKWRRNDMLWGRLDGTERLICAVMPAQGDAELRIRNGLIREAQAAILAEDLHLENIEAMSKALAQCLASHAPGEGTQNSMQATVESLLKQENSATLSLAMQSVLQACLKDRNALWDFYKASYDVDRRVDPQQAVRSMARATRVTAQMLDAVAASYRIQKSPFAWLAMFASMFWGLVEIAVPQTLLNLLARHWFTLLYLIALGMIAGGMLVAQPAISKFGWLALAGTAGIHALATITGFYITGAFKGRWFSLLKWLLTVALAALLIGGALYYYDLWRVWRSA